MLFRDNRRKRPGGCDVEALAAASMPKRKVLTLAICSRNRADKLRNALQAIARLKAPRGWDIELVVVDNGSTDGTPDVFAEILPRFHFPARLLCEPAAGAGHALNRAYRNSRGEIIAFTDDDCCLDARFLTATVRAFDDERIGVVTGRILLQSGNDAPLTLAESIIPRRFAAGGYQRPGHFQGANLSFRRAALDDIGGFDPLFGPGSYIGSGADCDAAYRAGLAGWDGLYDPAVVVYHGHGRSEADRHKLMRRYAIGSGGYHAKMLFEQGRIGHYLRYLCDVPKKLLVSPETLRWELIGAARFLRRPRIAPATAR